MNIDKTTLIEIEDYIQHLDEKFGLKPETIFDIEKTIAKYHKELKNIPQELPLRPSFWFMRDNHTFIKLKGKTVDEIRDLAIEVAKENPYGMVCPVTILQGEKELRRVGESCHVNAQGEVDLTKWWYAITKESCVRYYEGEA